MWVTVEEMEKIQSLLVKNTENYHSTAKAIQPFESKL